MLKKKETIKKLNEQVRKVELVIDNLIAEVYELEQEIKKKKMTNKNVDCKCGMNRFALSTIRLFKAVPITRTKIQTNKHFLNETISKGFIFSPDVICAYPEKELFNLIKIVELEIGTSEQMNSSFHKSWRKVRDASIEQLVIEQIIHYFTTYGFETLGIYNKDSVYIPNEKLKIPDLDIDGINLVVIKGYTKKELKERLLALLQTGIALDEDTINDVVDVALYVELKENEIAKTKNKEVKITLYNFLNLIPEDPMP